LVRVWSTDWWVDKRGALERLDDELKSLLVRSREAPKHQPMDRTPAPVPDSIEYAVVETTSELLMAAEDEVLPSQELAGIYARSSEAETRSAMTYQEADLSIFSATLDPKAFYEPHYDDVLRAIVAHVVTSEAPMSIDALVNRVARAHGFQRSGRLIRERVLAIAELSYHLANDAIGTCFVWRSSADPKIWRSFRIPAPGSNPRSIDDIPFEEIRAASGSVTGSDRITETARTLGVRRLSPSARRRIELAIE